MAYYPISNLSYPSGTALLCRFQSCAIVVVFLFLAGALNSSEAMACCQTTVGNSPQAHETQPALTDTSEQQLFQDLENDKFWDRENATEELIKRGDAVLPEIAKRYFTAPPETVHRIRKILEGIGASGDEKTFLRATSLLLTLYSNGNEEMVQRIEILKAQWRKRRKEEAVSVILAAGGRVVNAFNTQPQLRQALVIRSSSPSESAQAADNKSATPVKLDVDQQRELVAEIMENSADENRSFILQHAKTNSAQKRPTFNQYAYSSPQPLSIQFPHGWVATEKVLSKLGELDGPVALELGGVKMNDAHWRKVKNTDAIISIGLDAVKLPKSATGVFPPAVRAIKLANYSLDPDFCKSLSQFSSLGVLQLSNCRLSIDSVNAINQLKRISNIPVDFEDFKLDADSISSLTRLKRARAITMTNVQVSPAALAELEDLPQINSLKLSSMTVSKELLASVGRMQRLAQLELRGCEFDVDAFKRLESTRRIRIDFQPKAFLGVGPQSGGRPGSIGCQIAYIAPASSAANAGIRVGDVIRSIDGDPVKTFHEVRLKIAQYNPGEKMKMKIQRGSKQLDLSIELGKNASSER